MTRRRSAVFVSLILILALSVSMLLPAYAASQSDIDALEASRQELKNQQADLQTTIDGLENEKDSVVAQKVALDEQNELARQELEVITEQIALYKELVDAKSKELDSAVAAEDQQLEVYQSHVRAMEENGKYTYIALIFSSKSLSELLTNIDMVNEIMDADARLYDQYTAARENTEAVKAEYEDTLAGYSEKETELNDAKAALEQKIADASALIASLEEDIEAYKTAYAEIEADEAAVQAQIVAIAAQMAAEEAAKKAAEEEAKKAAEEAANAGNSGNSSGSSGTGSSGSSDTGSSGGSSSGGSSSATGTLIWPCPSSHNITSPYGMRLHPIYNEYRMHNGIDISAAEGSAIVAADGGTIAVATYSKSAGNYIVIYHANGMTTTYMHMSSFAVSVNQTVTQGQTIGYVGSTGDSTGPHLHFEVTVNGSRVDPQLYVS